MPRERKQRGPKHAEKRRLEREQTEKKYLESQLTADLFHDRPKNPFGLLTHEDERFFSEVQEEFEKNEWADEDTKEAFIKNVVAEMKGKELKIATSFVSRFLEDLLPLCSTGELVRVMGVFKGHVRALSRHRFGSFTVEKVVGYVGVGVAREGNGTEEQIDSLQTVFREITEVIFILLSKLILGTHLSRNVRVISRSIFSSCILSHTQHINWPFPQKYRKSGLKETKATE